MLIDYYTRVQFEYGLRECVRIACQRLGYALLCFEYPAKFTWLFSGLLLNIWYFVLYSKTVLFGFLLSWLYGKDAMVESPQSKPSVRHFLQTAIGRRNGSGTDGEILEWSSKGSLLMFVAGGFWSWVRHILLKTSGAIVGRGCWDSSSSTWGTIGSHPQIIRNLKYRGVGRGGGWVA